MNVGTIEDRRAGVALWVLGGFDLLAGLLVLLVLPVELHMEVGVRRLLG